MRHLLVSIIIPVYGVEKFLDKCVQSAVDQTYKYIEIILVDDGSPDSCPYKCDWWSEKDDRVQVIHKKNGGLSDARNAGLRKAKGEYVYFLDSDDSLFLDAIEKCMEAAEQRVDTIVVQDTQLIWNHKVGLRKCGCYGCLNKKEFMQALFDGHIPNYACGKLFPRCLWNEIFFPVSKSFEDIRTIYRVMEKADRVICLESVGYKYLQRNGSITDAAISTRKDAIDAYKEQLEFAKHKYPEATVFLSYRVEEVSLRWNLLNVERGIITWYEFKNRIRPFRKLIGDNWGLLIKGKFEPGDYKRTISIIVLLACPRLYRILYNIFIYLKNKSKV